MWVWVCLVVSVMRSCTPTPTQTLMKNRKIILNIRLGRSALQARDEDFSSNFSITRLDPTDNVDDALPSRKIR